MNDNKNTETAETIDGGAVSVDAHVSSAPQYRKIIPRKQGAWWEAMEYKDGSIVEDLIEIYKGDDGWYYVAETCESGMGDLTVVEYIKRWEKLGAVLRFAGPLKKPIRK